MRLPEPVDDTDNMLVIGIGCARSGWRDTQIDQLLEIGALGGTTPALRITHRARQTEKLNGVTGDVLRIGHYPAHFTTQELSQFIGPVRQARLGGGDYDMIVMQRDRQNAMPTGVLAGRDFSNTREVDRQRVDPEIR